MSSTVPVSGKHFWALIGSLLLWGTSFPAMKYALLSNHPLAVMFFRYLFSFLLVLAVFVWRYRREIPALLRNRDLLLIGLFNFLGSALQFIGIQKTTSTKSAVLTQTIIVVVPLLAYFMIGERLNARKIAAMAFSLIGALFISTNLRFSGLLQHGTLVGDLLVLAAVVFWALFIVYTRKATQNLDSIHLLFPSQLVTMLFSALTAGVDGHVSCNAGGLAVALFLAVFCTIIPTTLYNYSLKVIDATTSSIIGPVELLTAMGISFAFLGDRLSLVEGLGCLLIVVAVYLSIPHKAAAVPDLGDF